MINHSNTIKLGVTSNGLKILAILTMTIDHTAAVLLSPSNSYYLPFRLIGRIAFPIFCFLIVEGSLHTKNIKKYLLRLGLFALISEVPFDLAFNRSYNYPYHQNVFFTLFLGLTVIALHNLFVKYKKKYLSIVFFILAMFIAIIMKTDYGAKGVLLIYILFIARNKGSLKNLLYILGILQLSLNGNNLINIVQACAILSVIPISMYTGSKGRSFNKYILYGFYPIHLLFLYYLSMYI